jgi:hypothetical protein
VVTLQLTLGHPPRVCPPILSLSHKSRTRVDFLHVLIQTRWASFSRSHCGRTFNLESKCEGGDHGVLEGGAAPAATRLTRVACLFRFNHRLVISSEHTQWTLLGPIHSTPLPSFRHRGPIRNLSSVSHPFILVKAPASFALDSKRKRTDSQMRDRFSIFAITSLRPGSLVSVHSVLAWPFMNT